MPESRHSKCRAPSLSTGQNSLHYHAAPSASSCSQSSRGQRQRESGAASMSSLRLLRTMSVITDRSLRFETNRTESMQACPRFQSTSLRERTWPLYQSMYPGNDGKISPFAPSLRRAPNLIVRLLPVLLSSTQPVLLSLPLVLRS